jgi:CRP-like cAMP-binding protein
MSTKSHPDFLWKDLFKAGNSQASLIEQALRDNILFKTLDKKELAYLKTLVHERTYQPDEVVFEQNDRGIGMYVIAKGRVAIRSQSPNGKNEILVTHLNAGSFFGEVALVDPDNLRTAKAIAVEPTTLIGFFKPDLQTILDRKPAMGVKILFQLSTVLGRRLMETTEKITRLSRHQKSEQKDENAI